MCVIQPSGAMISCGWRLLVNYCRAGLLDGRHVLWCNGQNSLLLAHVTESCCPLTSPPSLLLRAGGAHVGHVLQSERTQLCRSIMGADNGRPAAPAVSIHHRSTPVGLLLLVTWQAWLLCRVC